MKTKTKPTKAGPKHGDLRIWWVPQIPMKSFTVPVADLAEASLLLDVLADYDAFQFENNVKPDYSNAGGLNVYNAFDEKPDWYDWYSDDGEDFQDLHRNQGTEKLRQLRDAGELPRWEDAGRSE